jgi:hypothetical protein
MQHEHHLTDFFQHCVCRGGCRAGRPREANDEPSDAQMQNALALREVRVMKSYRPKLLRMGTATVTARIWSEIFDVLVQTGTVGSR